jgi:hypothetical protein
MIKTLLFLLFVFWSPNSFAQTSYIVTKKGDKIIVQDGADAWDIIVIDKRISYKLPGKTWEKYITFSDLDYAMLGAFKFKSFVINKRKKAYFVQAEANGKSLISLAVTTVTTNGNMSLSSTNYEVYIVDDQGAILAQLDFHSYKNKISAAERAKMPGMIKAHFPDCAKVIAAIDSANTNDEFNLGILDFLDSPFLMDCD